MGNKQSYNLNEDNVQYTKNNAIVSSEIAFTYDTARGINLKATPETKITVISHEPSAAPPEPKKEEIPVHPLRRMQPMPHVPLATAEKPLDSQVHFEVAASG